MHIMKINILALNLLRNYSRTALDCSKLTIFFAFCAIFLPLSSTIVVVDSTRSGKLLEELLMPLVDGIFGCTKTAVSLSLAIHFRNATFPNTCTISFLCDMSTAPNISHISIKMIKNQTNIYSIRFLLINSKVMS